jgi:hypothetical protein
LLFNFDFLEDCLSAISTLKAIHLKFFFFLESRDLRATSKTLSTKTHGQGNCQSTRKVPVYGGGWFGIAKSGRVWLGFGGVVV